MSGTFNDIDVPPTLVSFAVDVAKVKDVITPEFKKAGSKLVWLRAPKDSYDLPDYPALMEQYDKLHQDIQSGRVISVMTVRAHAEIWPGWVSWCGHHTVLVVRKIIGLLRLHEAATSLLLLLNRPVVHLYLCSIPLRRAPCRRTSAIRHTVAAEASIFCISFSSVEKTTAHFRSSSPTGWKVTRCYSHHRCGILGGQFQP